MAKVSICIPAYENPQALDRLLSSIAIQSYTDYQVYITDDSKSDVDEEVVKRWLQDERLSGKLDYEKNEVSKGASANTKYCMAKANGEYMKIMHHDDSFAEADSLAKMVKLLDDNADVDFAFAGTLERYYREDGSEDEERIERKSLPDLEAMQLKESPFSLYMGNFVEGPSTTIIRHKGIELDESLKWLVDIDYYIRVLLDNPKYAVSKEHLINMGHLSTQVTQECLQDGDLIYNETRYVYNKYGLKSEKKYRKYLIRMGLKHGKHFKDMKGIGIPFFEYLAHKIRVSARIMLKGK